MKCLVRLSFLKNKAAQFSHAKFTAMALCVLEWRDKPLFCAKDFPQVLQVNIVSLCNLNSYLRGGGAFTYFVIKFT